MSRKFIKIGTKVDSPWGETKVTGIELCQNGEKYGIDMPKIFLEDMDFEKYADFALNYPLLFIYRDNKYFNNSRSNSGSRNSCRNFWC